MKYTVDRLDPEIAAMLALLPEGDYRDVEAGRAHLKEVLAPVLAALDTSGVSVREEKIPGWQGAPQVAVRVYTPERVAARALVFDIHGGGFTHGDLDSDHMDNIELARDLGVVVVSVDYRLAPEAPFPAGLDDCYAALTWAVNNAADLGVDPTLVALHGTSAGAGLCAGLALLARDRGGPAIAFQMLHIPELDDQTSSGSMQAFSDTPVWNRPFAQASWDFYLGPGVRGTDSVSPYAAPARAKDLTGLPPAYISAMEFDPMRDEAIAYAQALMAAGIPVELHVFPGTFHGAIPIVRHAGISQRGRAETRAVLARAFDVTP